MKGRLKKFAVSLKFLEIHIYFVLRILDLWLSWGENRSDVEFRLKINKKNDRTRRLLIKKVREFEVANCKNEMDSFFFIEN